MTVRVTQKDQVEVETVEELDHLLDAIDAEARAKGRPLDVLVSLEGHGSLDIVVGGERSWLHHTPDDRMPPYKVSQGDCEAEGVFEFLHEADHLMEGLWQETVPVDRAREAARYFFRTGKVDDRIRWAEV